MHDLLLNPRAGSQLDDVAVGIAHIDRSNEAVIDWTAHIDPPSIGALFSIRSNTLDSTSSAMCRSSVSCRLNSNGFPGTSKNARQETLSGDNQDGCRVGSPEMLP
jgi:hypothetical protein